VGAGGRVHFAQFYARRVRRLLPAAALVLLVTAVVCVRALPPHPAGVELREVHPSAGTHLAHQQPGDQETGQHKEHVDTDEPARHEAQPRVVEHHREHGDAA
jgi:hypothetical protein